MVEEENSEKLLWLSFRGITFEKVVKLRILGKLCVGEYP